MRLAIALLTSAALFGGCGDDDKTSASTPSGLSAPASVSVKVKDIIKQAEVVTPSGLDAKLTLEELQEIPNLMRNLDDAEITEIDGGFVFKNIEFDDTQIARVTVMGLAMAEDETPYFDSMTIEDLVVAGGDYDPDISIDKVFLNPPSYADFVKMRDSIDVDAMVEEELEFDAQPFIATGFGYMSGFEFSDEDGRATIGFVGWSGSESQEDLTILMKDLGMNLQGDGMDFPFKLDLGELSIKNMDVAAVESSFTANPFHYNMFEPYFESYNIEDFVLSADSFYIAQDQFASWVTEPEAGVKHLYVSPNPLLIGFDGEPETEDMQAFKEGFDKLRYERIEISFHGHQIYDNNNDRQTSVDSKLVIKDAMEMGFEIDMSGMNSTMTNLREIFADMEMFSEQFSEDETALREELKAAIAPLDIRAYNFSITDKSLLDRVYKVAAEYQDSDPDAIKEQVSGAVTLMTILAQTPYQSELALEYSDAFSDFIEQGGTFKFSIQQDNSIDIVDAVWDMMEEMDELGYGEMPDFDPVLKFFGLSFEHIPAVAQ